jgi:hypothetical protein
MIWTETTDYAAGGAALAEATVEAHRVPDEARMLLGWRPIDHVANAAADESQVAVFGIGGGNFNYQPQEVICGNVAPSLMATGGLLQAPSEYYDVFAPVKGGETINITVEPCDAIAGNRRDAAELTWSDIALPLPVIKSRCSREVAVQLAGVTAGTDLTLAGAHELIEYGGVMTVAAHTVEEEALVTMVLKCSALRKQELSCLFEACGAIADLAVDENSPVTYLARRTCKVPFKQEAATITCGFDLDVALTNAGQAVHYVRWI